MSQPQPQPRTILIIDDDPGMRMTIAANIEVAGYQVEEAESGEEALHLLAAGGEFDLILTDIRMPGLNGVELFKKVKELNPDLPVVMMTAYAAEDLEHEALYGGAFTILYKPFDMERALYVIAQALRRPLVLILEDQQEPRERLIDVFYRCGYKAMEVPSGEAAARALRTSVVDVAILDLTSSKESTTSIINELAAIDPSIWVIVMTGARAQAPGQVAHHALLCLKRPSDIKQLIRTVAEVRSKGP